MKKLIVNLFLILVSLVVVSCDSDNDSSAYENSYTFGYTVWIRDIDGRNLLNENVEKKFFSADKVMVKALSEKDNVTFEISTNDSENVVKVEIEPFDTEGVLMHLQVLKWEYENETITDTVRCEIEKSGNAMICKKIWVNNHLKWEHVATDINPWFALTKISPEHIGLRDEKNTDSRVDTVIEGIKFVYWLSDMDGNETNSFDRHDVEERGFNFNLSVVNNTNEVISFDNDAFAPFLGYVFDLEKNEAMRTCVQFEDIFINYEIRPGEIHHEKIGWCNSIDNLVDSRLLSSGKYYTYFYKEKLNINMAPEKTINIPPMFINIEIK